jgi:cell division protein FtsI (penicillin-binding protein 3)
LRLNGWSAAGKTGTAQIFENGHYTHLYNASFMGFAPVNNPALVAIVTINGTTGDAGMGASAAGPVWVKVMDEALRLYNVPRDLPETSAPRVAPASTADLNEVAIVTGDRGQNILEDDPSIMPSLDSVPMGDASGETVVASTGPSAEQGAALAPPMPGHPSQSMIPDAQHDPSGAAPPPAAYNGPVAPDFQGKPMRAVVREAYAMGVTIKPEGSGVARAQKPAAGTPIRAGDSIRVVFSR